LPEEQANGLTVVDLNSPELTVVGRLALPPFPLLVLPLPDGEHHESGEHYRGDRNSNAARLANTPDKASPPKQ